MSAADNRPEPSEFHRLDDDEEKVEYEKDQKLTNCGVLNLNKEDHTLGNFIRSHLLMDKRVLFAGYRIPHPLTPLVRLKVRTTAETSPLGAINDAIKNAVNEVDKIEHSFTKALEEFESQNVRTEENYGDLMVTDSKDDAAF
mmetsp:Transcript_24760/g.34580  ORF Transcript_24760/g.34580 Transcript_24760/m.34580 type:complete len:142 (+) Transcript_24760:102-527(+)